MVGTVGKCFEPGHRGSSPLPYCIEDHSPHHLREMKEEETLVPSIRMANVVQYDRV